MDATGITSIATAVLPSAPAATRSALPQQGTGAAPRGQAPHIDGFDASAAERKRLEAVRKASQDIANIYVVSDQRFTIFKDATGQYITRFTSLRDGKVTYIPEPSLFKRDGESGFATFNMKA